MQGCPSTTVTSENWTAAFGEVMDHLESPANPVMKLVQLKKIAEPNKKDCVKSR